MKKTFLSCDRCGAPVTNSTNNTEIELLIISEETGKEEMKGVDLCNDCRNSLKPGCLVNHFNDDFIDEFIFKPFGGYHAENNDVMYNYEGIRIGNIKMHRIANLFKLNNYDRQSRSRNL